MRLLVGVDAGASHTEAVVADEDLQVLGRHRGAPGAVRVGGAVASAEAIRDTVRGALDDAGLEASPDVVVVGAAGAGSDETRAELTEALAEVLGAQVTVRVTTDAAIALEAAFADRPGIVLLAGSGSIAFGRDAAGNVWRAGGLGREVGDEGSGYALARAALGAVGRAADGRAAATELTERLMQVTATDSAAALLAWAHQAAPHDVAALARPVGEAAVAGDAVARTLVEQAARDLALHVAALVGRFPPDEMVPVALAGGLVRPGSPVRDALVGLLTHDATRVDVSEEEVDPPLGALRLAARVAT
jgi:glucosamine kinase